MPSARITRSSAICLAGQLRQRGVERQHFTAAEGTT
jgi:hypothetical protein